MTDELNGESGFEIIEKKAEFQNLIDIPKTDTFNITVNTGSMLTSTTKPLIVENVLSNIEPPSALPTFITNSVTITPNLISNISQELIKEQICSDNPQLLIAHNSSKKNTVALTESLFTWVKHTVTNSSVFSKVAEKAKNSVNSMITILDPQMQEYIYSGGNTEIIVTSDKNSKIAPIREAFQNIFGNATVNGNKVEKIFDTIQPIGFAAGIKAAQERITAMRKNSSIPHDIPIIAVQNFLIEIGEGKWHDLEVIILENLKHNIHLQIFTQMTPLPNQSAKTAQKFTLNSQDDLATTISLPTNLEITHSEWHSALCGVSKKDIIFLAAQSLANIYKNIINPIS